MEDGKNQGGDRAARQVRTRAEIRDGLKRPGWGRLQGDLTSPEAVSVPGQVSVASTTNQEEQTIKKPRRRLRIALVGLLLLVMAGLVGQVIYQFNYPRDLALPGAEINGQAVSGKKLDQLEFDLMNWFKEAEIELAVAENPPEKIKLTDLGASLDLSLIRQNLFNYPDEARYIPFSIWRQEPKVEVATVTFNQQILEAQVKKLAKKYDKAPVNSNIKLVAGEKIQATEAKAGQRLDQKALIKQIQNLEFKLLTLDQALKVTPEAIKPAKTAEDLQDVIAQVELAKSKKITIWTVDQARSFVPTEAEIVSWLKLGENEVKQTTVAINSAKVGEYLKYLNQRVGRPTSPTIIKMVDGREQSRVTGAVGTQIDQADFRQQLESALFAYSSEVKLNLKMLDVPSTVQRTWSFSNTQAGLQAKLQELAGRYNVRIAIKQLDGAGWQASVRAGESTLSASTYKLYVAAKLFEQMEAGNVRWTDPMLDTDVAGCFERMIVVSTNPCAEEWIRRFGRQNINNFIWSKGISQGTTFTNPTATHTTAADLIKIEELLYNGTLARNENHSKLMNAMSRQMWRSGIPTGTRGWTQDKVGFLWDYVHDAGIVHHPRGTYIMAVMTKGASYSVIAQITREVEALMYP